MVLLYDSEIPLIPAAALVLFAAACSESAPSAPSTKPPPPQILGYLTGEVNDSVMTATFTPVSGSINKFTGGFNAAKVSPGHLTASRASRST